MQRTNAMIQIRRKEITSDKESGAADLYADNLLLKKCSTTSTIRTQFFTTPGLTSLTPNKIALQFAGGR